jgi:hypothetical protein
MATRWLLILFLCLTPSIVLAQAQQNAAPLGPLGGNSSGGGGGSGTVTSVSVATANGVSGSVANPTTTPAITLTLGAITPTSVNGNTLTTGTGTLTLGAGKTVTISNTLTFTGTDSSSVAFGTGGTVLYSGGTLGTPSSGVGTNITGIQNANVSATPFATGSSTGNTLTAPRGYFVCTSTCTVTPPVPAAGYEFCVLNDDNVNTIITLGALGSSARYEATARTGYGTAGTGTLSSAGAVGDMICIVGRDSTHYLSTTYVGTWTAS